MRIADWLGVKPLSLILFLFVMWSSQLSALTVAGTVITNQAEISWLDDEGILRTTQSNISEVTVAAQYDLILVPDNIRHTQAGQNVDLPHRLTNTGNIASEYEIRIRHDSDDQGDLTDLIVVSDVNGNGLSDADEPLWNEITCEPLETNVSCYFVPEMDPSESIDFVINGNTPINALVDDEYKINIRAFPNNYEDLLTADGVVLRDVTPAFTAAIASSVLPADWVNNDLIDIIEGAVLTISKTVTPGCSVTVDSGESISYGISFSNTGEAAPITKIISIDGEDIAGVVLEDTLPSNVTLNNVSAPIAAPSLSIIIVQLSDDEDTERWVRFSSWNGSDAVSKIGLYIPEAQLQPNQSGNLDFDVIVNENTTTSMINNQAVFDLVSGGEAEFVSNSVCSTLEFMTNGAPADEAEIRFLLPTLDIRREITQNNSFPDFQNDSHFEDAEFYGLDNALNEYDVIRDGVYIELDSSAVNQDETVAENIVVTVTSGTGDTLLVTLLETGPNTGIFRSLAPIRMSTSDSGNGGSCPSGSSLTPNYSVSDESCVLNGESSGGLSVSAEITITGDIVQQLLQDAALIDPLGVVFDSAYNTPVAGAIVTIRNADGSVALDPLTDLEYEPQVTGEDGRYQFPFLFPNQSYYLDVVAPEEYTFPSAIAAENFPTREVNEFSYGRDGFADADGNRVENSGVFFLTSLLVVDIPLDPEIDTDLTVNKTASRSELDIGGFVTYTVVINNHVDGELNTVNVYDELPRGFNLVEGSVTLDERALSDYEPEGAPRPNLVFSNLPFQENEPSKLGVITGIQEHVLTYRVRTTAAAVGSDGVNTVQVSGLTETNTLVTSNTSRATVEIKREGVLSDKGIVFGKVFVDADCNNIQNGGEWPIGGVKLYLQDGTWVITDSNGQYSIYGLNPGNYVIKLDPITLPEGVVFKPTDNRQLADPNSRLVDLANGEFHRADFAAVCPKENHEEVYEELKARNQGKTDWLLEDAQNYDPDKTLVTDAQRTATNADGDISNGAGNGRNSRFSSDVKRDRQKSLTTGYSVEISQFRDKSLAQKALSELPIELRKESFVHEVGDFYTVRHGFSLYKKEMQARHKTTNFGADARVVPTVYEQMSDEVADKLETPRGFEAILEAKEAVKSVNNKQAKEGVWLWPKTDVSLDGRFMVTVRKGLSPTLMVNGKAVPKSQLGEQIENRREKAQVVAWYGVQLAPGKNELEVVAKDLFGNKRVLAKGTFTRPISAEKLVIEAKVKRLPADGGRSYLPITIKLLDSNGYLARGVNFVTIDATDGQWVERDIQDQTQGHQVRVVNGLRVVHLKSSERSGDVHLKMTDGSMRDEIKIVQTSPLRPLIAVGLVDVGAYRFNRDRNSPDIIDESDIHGRVAAFIKGRVRGDTHLTVSIDTDKDDDAELFRDINPNESYPIYGDSSQRGYEAQSRSKVYAKLEKDDDSIAWGDFVTDGTTINEDVTRVQRTLTGVNAVVRDDKNEWRFFVSEQDEEHVIEQIRGQGVALNYRLSQYPLVRNSETIEIITVSRDNSGVVLSTEELSRFGDYTLDDVTGELSFSETVPSIDEDLNPIYIRASYDLEEGAGDDYIVAGARFTHKVNEDFKVGLSYTTDQEENDGFDIYGLLLDYKDEKGLTVRGSIAEMTHQDDSIENGVAGRLYLSKDWTKDSQTSLILGRAGEGFTNSSAGISENREELRLKHTQKIYDDISAEIEAIHSRNLETDDTEQSIGVTADVKVKDWTLTAGVRHIEQESDTEDERFQTFIIGAKHALDIMGKKGSVGAEYEQDFDDTDRKRLALTADLQIHDRVKLYAKGERITSLTGISGLSSSSDTQDTIAIGFKSDFLKSTELYSEYRVRGAIDDRDLETASGIRGTYELEKGLSITPNLEYIKNIDGDEGDSIAASIAIKDSRHKDQIASLRLETRHDDDREYYGLQADYVKRLDTNWSALFKDTLRYTKPETGDDLLDNTLTLGLAYRPKTNNQYHSLFYYQNTEERGGSDGDCSTHVLSTHQNYAIKEDILISGRLGGKHEDCDGDVSEAVVLDGRLTWDITNRLDIDLRGGVLGTDGLGETQYSLGAGVNYLVKENLRLGIGYNVVGFEDDDLDPENYNDEGLYIGLQYKFDEKSLNWLTGEK